MSIADSDTFLNHGASKVSPEFKSNTALYFFFFSKAPHMKPIRRCWNALHGSGVDLWRRMALFRKRELVWCGGEWGVQCFIPAGDGVWRPSSLG